MATEVEGANEHIDTDALRKMYESMLLIREAEEMLLKLFSQNRVPGFIHSYIGEEAVGVGVCSALRPDDYITSTHRGHGHILAKGGELRPFFAELYGKSAGYCKGKGGSMHVANLELGILGANGVVGAGIPIAAGAALATQLEGNDRVAVSFTGDGASDIGAFHESLNLASLWELPFVCVVENNGYADFISQRDHQKIEKIADRASSYDMPGVTVDGNDAVAVFEAATVAIARARAGGGPTLLECVTYRWRGHYEGDPQAYRTDEEVERWKVRDPLLIAEHHLQNRGVDVGELRGTLEEDIRSRIQDAVEFAESEPFPTVEEALDDVYTDLVEQGWNS